MQVYIVHLAGQGDTEIKFVDKETWEWINSSNLGQSNEDKGKTSWCDVSCPESIRKPMIEEGIIDNINEFPVITIGSLQNDRALLAPPMLIDNKRRTFWNHESFIEFLKDNEFEILGEFEGYIY